MKKLLTALMVFVVAGAAIADDLAPPPWRIPGQPLPPGATYQEWTWDRGAQNPNDGTADNWINPYASPSNPPTVVHPNPDPPYPILETFEGRVNVLCLDPGRTIKFRIPNEAHPAPFYKEVWMQLTYFAPSGTPLPQPLPPSGGTGATIGHMALPGSWMHSTFSLTYPDCPEFEILSIINNSSNPIYIDQVVIDTLCVPEPATFAALGVGAIAMMRRRKQIKG